MERLSILYRQISPLVLTESSPSALSIKTNRPKALNAFNYEILTSITILVQQNPGKTLIFSSTLPKSFCAGGDVTDSVQRDTTIVEFYRTELSTFYTVSREEKTVVLMQGFCIGAGNGLVMACKFRVATQSTKFMMPEATIGHVPDTGASYFLTHIPNKAFGMYEMVTGKALSGYDCYQAKLATHFVKDELIESLHKDLLASGDIEACLAKYASQPDPQESFLVKNAAEIEEVFGNVTGIEDIIKRLKAKKTKFAVDTLKDLSKLCPLSLKVAVRSFLLGVNKSYNECLTQDYNIEMQLCFRRSYNYTTSVTKKFINKEKGDPEWHPKTIEEVTEEMVNAVIENREGPMMVFK